MRNDTEALFFVLLAIMVWIAFTAHQVRRLANVAEREEQRDSYAIDASAP